MGEKRLLGIPLPSALGLMILELPLIRYFRQLAKNLQRRRIMR